jgi:transposase-like protein
MAKKKRHSIAEITSLLQDAMAAAGRTQSQIAQALGISVMTYHRWRKGAPAPVSEAFAAPKASPSAKPAAAAPHSADRASAARIAELQLENARLRKLVTDLLLEKMRLEEDTPRTNSAPERK